VSSPSSFRILAVGRDADKEVLSWISPSSTSSWARVWAGTRPRTRTGWSAYASARPGESDLISADNSDWQIRALMGILGDEGIIYGPQGRMNIGDYVTSDRKSIPYLA
jgi:hypothetical protein